MTNTYTALSDSGSLLRKNVYELILHDLQEGIILPGQNISLMQLAQKLNISKTPLRDALLELQTEGFVTLYPQRGVVVNELSEHAIKEIYEICSLLDSNLIRKNFHKITKEHVQLMEKINQNMKVDVCLHYDRYNKLNYDFHAVYLELDDNAWAKKIIRNSRIKLFQFSKRNWGEAFQKGNYNEHQQLIEIIKNGSAEEAEQFVKTVHWSLNW